MQIVYATHLVLPDSEDGSALDAAANVVVDWVQRRFDVEVSPLSGGRGKGRRATVDWESLLADDRGIISIEIDQEDQYDDTWRWRSFVELGVEDGSAWVRVRVSLYSPLEGVLTRPQVHAGRPGVVRALADQLPIEKDGWQLGEWRRVEREHVDRFLAFLESAERELPVVALSRGADGEPFIDPAHLADRLLGLAHVVVVSPEASYGVTERIGKTLSCFGGAVRVYWPGFDPGDDPYHHRLFVRGNLSFLGRDGVERELFEMFGRLAGLSLGEPLLRRRLKIEQREAELREREAARYEASERVAEVAASPDTVDQEAFNEFVTEFEEMRTRADEAERELLDAEIENEALRRERDDAIAQTVVLSRMLADGRARPADVPVVAEPPSSVVEAVRQAMEKAEHAVYLPAALEAAEESQYGDPVRVLDDLALINEIATDWANGDLDAGPHEAFKQRCSGYRDGISKTAATQYSGDYMRQYEGETITLGPHIRRGTGAVAAILRIYMYFDTERQKIVVGHVGRKLRDASNRK